MSLMHPTAFALQNLWLTLPFWLAFVCLLFCTGAWLGLLLAFVLASLASLAFRTLVNRRSASQLLSSRAAHHSHSHIRSLAVQCAGRALTVSRVVCGVCVQCDRVSRFSGVRQRLQQRHRTRHSVSPAGVGLACVCQRTA